MSPFGNLTGPSYRWTDSFVPPGGKLTPVDETHLLVRTEAVEEIKAALQEELEKNTYVKVKD